MKVGERRPLIEQSNATSSGRSALSNSLSTIKGEERNYMY